MLMLRTPPLRSLLWVLLAATPGLLACSSSDDDGSQSDAFSVDGIVREGAASQTQLNTFVRHRPREWEWAGGQFDTPDDNATLAADTPVTFAWHADPANFAQADDAGEVVMTHLLVFSTRSNERLLGVFTTLPEYTPNAKDWQKLVDAGKPIALDLTTASFVGADLPEEGGPFIGQTITFAIQ